MVVLGFVDEIRKTGPAPQFRSTWPRAQVIVPIDDFPVQLRAQAFLLDVPTCCSFQVGANAQAAHISSKSGRAGAQPGFLINPKIANLDSAAWVSQQFTGGRVLQQGFLNVQRGAELLAGDQHFPSVFSATHPAIRRRIPLPG